MLKIDLKPMIYEVVNLKAILLSLGMTERNIEDLFHLNTMQFIVGINNYFLLVNYHEELEGIVSNEWELSLFESLEDLEKRRNTVIMVFFSENDENGYFFKYEISNLFELLKILKIKTETNYISYSTGPDEDIENFLSTAFTSNQVFSLEPDDKQYRKVKVELLKEKTEDSLTFEQVVMRMLREQKTVKVHDTEEDKFHYLTLGKMDEGLQLLKEKHPNLIEQDDFVTYDAILQLALFGELIYG